MHLSMAVEPFFTSTVWTDYETNAREFECYWFKKGRKIWTEFHRAWHPSGTMVSRSKNGGNTDGLVFIRKAAAVVPGVMAKGVYMTSIVFANLFNFED